MTSPLAWGILPIRSPWLGEDSGIRCSSLLLTIRTLKDSGKVKENPQVFTVFYSTRYVERKVPGESLEETGLFWQRNES